jgi:hypothetical protein
VEVGEGQIDDFAPSGVGQSVQRPSWCESVCGLLQENAGRTRNRPQARKRRRRMLTVPYCRVSTEEQATEGFSIDEQADKLRIYAELHDLGDVTVIADPDGRTKTSNAPDFNRSSPWSTKDT